MLTFVLMVLIIAVAVWCVLSITAGKTVGEWASELYKKMKGE